MSRADNAPPLTEGKRGRKPARGQINQKLAAGQVWQGEILVNSNRN